MAPIVTMVGPKTPHGKESVVADVMQNIKVFVRCRPLKSNEKKNVIEVLSDRKEIRINESKNSNERYNSKTFTFDNTFGADTTQVEVYRAVVEPLIEQAIMGYNCTVFAYGQTGTGKTYTMEGERNTDDSIGSWADDPLAGIIPRALHQLFETLKTESTEHTVRVSFLELYNEELYDLLSGIDDTTKLKIFDDVSRKGSVIVGGLEEITVQSKAEIYEILRKGSAKRQTASTLLNACSSRSHTIFSVTVHIKENASDGEDLVKIGKLNLVDLAGSENIGRSGAIDKRAREAGNINQSLLTLGRVITSLVDRTPHIPYRESKLTRLLQESLGGRTKTSIIATISPNICDSDDTLSTLEYAQRAKKITNKPEINQKMTKKSLLREYTAEIERLRRDLAASREKNGIYVDEDNFKDMEQQIKTQTEEIQALVDQKNKIELLFGETKEELDQKTAQLEDTSKKLVETEHNLFETTVDLKEHKHLVEVHVNSEKVLSTQAKQLLNVVQLSTYDVSRLHEKVDRQTSVESNNWSKLSAFQEKFLNDMKGLEELVSVTTSSYNDSLDEMQKTVKEKTSTVEDILSAAQNQMLLLSDSMNEHKSRLSSLFTKDRLVLEQSISLKDNSSKLQTSLGHTFDEILLEVNECQKAIDGMTAQINETIAKQRQEVEELVMKQNTHLKSVSKTTVNSFNNLKKDLKSVFETQQQELSLIAAQMDQSIATNTEGQQAMAQQLDHVMKLMDGVVMEVNGLKVKSIKSRVEFENSGSKLCHKILETTKNQTNCLTEINAKVDGYVSALDCEQKVGLNYINSVDNLITESTQKLIEGLNDLSDKNITLPNHTKELIIAGKETLNKQVLDSDKLIDDSIKICDKQLIEKQSALKGMDETLSQGFDEQKSIVSNAGEGVGDIGYCVTEKASEVFRMSETMERAYNRQIDGQYKGFESLIKSDIKRVVPTGNTPQKTEYSFPRELVQTSPHQRILQRFRLNSACNTTLPEENDSEFLSDLSTSSKTSDSNDENVKPLKDKLQKPKTSLKTKSNSVSKLITESDPKSGDNQPMSRIVTPKPLAVNRKN